MSPRANFRAAVYVIPQRDNELLLARRANTGFGDGYFSLIAGHVEQREFARACAVREASEEAGITIQPEDLAFAHILQRHTADDLVYMDFFFVVTRWAGTPRIMEPHLCDALCWTPIDALPTNTLPYVRHTIDQVFVHGIPFSEFQSQALPVLHPKEESPCS
jgi:8-oxo-dGTP diphosphatase